MQSFFNLFKKEIRHIAGKEEQQIPTRKMKAPAIKAKLEARKKIVVDEQKLKQDQERAAANRAKILAKKCENLRAHRKHCAEVRQRKKTECVFSALKSLRCDKKLFAAMSRRNKNLKSTIDKAKQHNQDVIEKVVQEKLNEEISKEDLMRQIASRQKIANKNHMQHLLSVRQHTSGRGSSCQRHIKPVFIEEFWEMKQMKMDKRRCDSEQKVITMDDITRKMAHANILRMRQQAERYAKAHSVITNVSKVRVNRTQLHTTQAINSVQLDRKQVAAKLARENHLQQKQRKAMTHNEQVSDRVNQLLTERERAIESLMESIQAKIRHAAANRGNALLKIVQTAERLERHRISDVTPVSFDIMINKPAITKAHPQSAVQQRLEAQARNQHTMKELTEKLERAKAFRAKQREQINKRLRRDRRHSCDDKENNSNAKLVSKLEYAARNRKNALSAVKSRARLHNELVETRHCAIVADCELQRERKSFEIDARLNHAACLREKYLSRSRSKNSGCVSNEA